MTNDEALAMYQQVALHAEQGDNEAAHAAEDRLRERALEAILKGEGDHITLAAIALMSQDLRFARWCA